MTRLGLTNWPGAIYMTRKKNRGRAINSYLCIKIRQLKRLLKTSRWCSNSWVVLHFFARYHLPIIPAAVINKSRLVSHVAREGQRCFYKMCQAHIKIWEMGLPCIYEAFLRCVYECVQPACIGLWRVSPPGSSSAIDTRTVSCIERCGRHLSATRKRKWVLHK